MKLDEHSESKPPLDLRENCPWVSWQGEADAAESPSPPGAFLSATDRLAARGSCQGRHPSQLPIPSQPRVEAIHRSQSCAAPQASGDRRLLHFHLFARHIYLEGGRSLAISTPLPYSCSCVSSSKYGMTRWQLEARASKSVSTPDLSSHHHWQLRRHSHWNP